LLTFNWKVVLEDWPSLSVAVMVTVVLAGPSVLPADQLQVPSPLSMMMPADAVSVTVSAPGSA
jgi:hypothetical protein